MFKDHKKIFMLDTYYVNTSLTASACFSPASLVDNTSATPLLTLAILHTHVLVISLHNLCLKNLSLTHALCGHLMAKPHKPPTSSG